MDEKNKIETPLEEFKKLANNFRDVVTELGDILAKILPDVEIPDEDEEEEEEPWKMKCPYKVGDEYWFIFDNGHIDIDCWEGHATDFDRFKTGNAYPTEEKAELEAKRRNLLTRFRAFRDECNEGWIPSWSDNKEIKAYIQYHEQFNEFVVKYTLNRNILQTFGFFKCKQDAERAIELFGDEIKELFVKKEVGE